MAIKIKKRTIEEKYDVCDNCGAEFEHTEQPDYESATGTFKCNKCGKEVCSSCAGYMNFDFHIFKGCSGESLEYKFQCQGKHGFVVCIDCGREIKKSLENLGLKLFVNEDYKF